MEASPSKAPRLPLLLVGLPLVGLLALVGMAMCIVLLASGSAAGCETAPAGGSVQGVPKKLIPIYQEAAAEYRLGPKGPSVLAGINFEESTFGTNMATSSAGAIGWMAFLPSSWDAFGVDANDDGRKDPYDPEDAIFAAAHLLSYSGAPANWHDAIYSYNHAEWYVEDVLGDAAKWAAIGSIESGGACAAGAPNERVARMVAEAERLSAMRPHTEYVWGGSHGESPTPANGPFDCSSAVSHLLQVGGFENPTMTTVGFHTWGTPGPGRWLTILDKPFGGQAHVIIEFAPGVAPPSKRYWGTSAFVEPGHGPGWIPESTFDAGYLSGFERRHPEGF